jgi:hypothetical protein
VLNGEGPSAKLVKVLGQSDVGQVVMWKGGKRQ